MQNRDYKDLSEKEQLEYKTILQEWIEKIKEIPSYEDRHPNGFSNTLDGGYNGPYTELKKIYKPKLEAIMAKEKNKDKDNQRA